MVATDRGGGEEATSGGTGAPAGGERPPGAPLNVHLQQLAYLRAVAREGSISAAAEALHVSQPALSQALAELARRLERLRSGEGGTLSVGMIDAAGLYVLPEVVRAFREAHPGVELKLTVDTSEALLARLRAFELDLAFVVGPVEEADVSSAEVLREPLHIYAPPGDAGDPAAARWVLYPEGSRTRAIIDAALARAGIMPAVALESSNPAVLRQMVALGMGWSVLPPAIAEADGESAALRRGEQIAEA